MRHFRFLSKILRAALAAFFVALLCGPLVLSSSAQQTGTPPTSEYNVVVLGDSQSAGSTSYANYLGSLSGFTISKYAQVSRRASQIDTLLQKDLYKEDGKTFYDDGSYGQGNPVGRLSKNAITASTTHVIIWAGGNDIAGNGSVDSAIKSLTNIIERVKKLYTENGGTGQLKIVICHVTPAGTAYNDAANRNAKVPILNDKIDLTSSDYKIKSYPILKDTNGYLKAEYASGDGLHITSEAHKVIAVKIAKEVFGKTDADLKDIAPKDLPTTSDSTSSGGSTSGSTTPSSTNLYGAGAALDSQAIQLGAKIPIGEFGSQVENSSAGYFFVYVVKVFRWVAVGVGSVGVLIIVVGSIQIAASRGNTGLLDAGRKRITGAFIGIGLLFTCTIILIEVNPKFYTLEGEIEISLNYVSSSGNTQTFTAPFGGTVGGTVSGTKKEQAEKLWANYKTAIATLVPDEDDDFHRLVAAFATLESVGGLTYAGNSASALGLMQFVDSTANRPAFKAIFETVYPKASRYQANNTAESFDDWGCSKANVTQYTSLISKAYMSDGKEEDGRCNPFKSIKAGALHIKGDMDHYRDKTDKLRLAIMAYNLGGGNVNKLIQKTGKTDPKFEDLLPYITPQWQAETFPSYSGDKVKEVQNYTPGVYSLWEHIKSL